MIRKHSHVKIGRYHQVQTWGQVWGKKGTDTSVQTPPGNITPPCVLYPEQGSGKAQGRPLLGVGPVTPSGILLEEGPSHVVVLLSLQHLQEQLDLDLSPLEYMMKCYPEIKEKEEMRKIIGRYGLTGKQQVREGDGKDPGWLRGCCQMVIGRCLHM